MHIAYIAHEFPPDAGFGGIGTYTCQIAKLMLASGCVPEVFSASFERNITESYEGFRVHRVKITSVKDFKNKVVKKFSEIHKNNPFQLIECPEVFGEAELVKNKYPDVPLIVRLHTPGVLITTMNNAYTPFLQKIRFVAGSVLNGKFDLGYWSKHDKNQMSDPDFLITKKAQLITAPSKAIKRWAIGFWGINPERIKVIPNPYMPPPDFLSIPLDAGANYITFIGRLSVLKGIVGFTKSIPYVLRKYPNWKFRFIGINEKSHIPQKSSKTWMQDQLHDYKDSIEFIDRVDYSKFYKYYFDTEICIFPSLFESFSYVCAEAMSAGRAIVGSRNGGMAELLDKGSGLLINPYKVGSIVCAINKFIENPELRKRCKKNARDRILNHFNAKKIGKQMLNTYKQFDCREKNVEKNCS